MSSGWELFTTTHNSGGAYVGSMQRLTMRMPVPAGARAFADSRRRGLRSPISAAASARGVAGEGAGFAIRAASCPDQSADGKRGGYAAGRGRKEVVLKVRTRGARPQSPPVALPHKSETEGVVTLATKGSAQLMVHGTPPRVTKRAETGGKGVRREATRSRWRVPERVAPRDGGAVEPPIESTMVCREASAKAQGKMSALLSHGDGVLAFTPCAKTARGPGHAAARASRGGSLTVLPPAPPPATVNAPNVASSRSTAARRGSENWKAAVSNGGSHECSP